MTTPRRQSWLDNLLETVKRHKERTMSSGINDANNTYRRERDLDEPATPWKEREQARPLSEIPAPRGEVAVAADKLADAVTTLDGAIGTLVMRLEPVLSPAKEAGGNPDKAQTHHSDLAKYLAIQTAKIEKITALLAQTITRCEL
jgi:hypothetical protein